MKVIKHGKNYVRYAVCDCGCEFEYDRKDVSVFKEYYELDRYGHNAISRKATNKEIKEGNDLVYYVNCPECGKNNYVKDGD